MGSALRLSIAASLLAAAAPAEAQKSLIELGVGFAPRDVSDDGSAAAGLWYHDFTFEPGRWTAEAGPEGLGFLAVPNSQGAHGVSADGSVVVGESDVTPYYPDPDYPVPSYYPEAFRWTEEGGMVGQLVAGSPPLAPRVCSLRVAKSRVPGGRTPAKYVNAGPATS